MPRVEGRSQQMVNYYFTATATVPARARILRTMSRSVYIASAEGETGKSTVALGLLDLLTRRVGRVGVFRPVSRGGQADVVVEMLLAHPGIDQELAAAMGVTYDDLHADRPAAHAEIVRRFADLSRSFDAVVVVGSDYTDVSTQSELEFNAQIAANLGAPVVLVISGVHRGPAEIRAASDRACAELSAGYARPVAVIANRVQPDAVDATRAALSVGSDL